MAELFIKPLVPQPITVSGFTQTTSPVAGYVMTTDGVGVGTWQPTNSHGDNITIANNDPILYVLNTAGNSNGATIAIESKLDQGAFEIVQSSSGVITMTNLAPVGSIAITTGAAGNLSLTSTAGEVKTQGTAIRLTAPIATVYDANTNVVGTDNGAVTQVGAIDSTVVLNTLSGIITTVSTGMVADSSNQFRLTNSEIVGATSLVSVWIAGYATAATGVPVVSIVNTAAGFCVIRLANVAATDPLNNVVKIGFLVL